MVEGLVIKSGPQVEVLNGISLHGGLAASWPIEASVTAKVVVASLIGVPIATEKKTTIFTGSRLGTDKIVR